MTARRLGEWQSGDVAGGDAMYFEYVSGCCDAARRERHGCGSLTDAEVVVVYSARAGWRVLAAAHCPFVPQC